MQKYSEPWEFTARHFNFEKDWRNTISFAPEIATLPADERDKFKNVVGAAYDEMVIEFESVAKECYGEWTEGAKEEVKGNVEREIESVIQEIHWKDESEGLTDKQKLGMYKDLIDSIKEIVNKD